MSWQDTLLSLADASAPLRASHLVRLANLSPPLQEELARLWPRIEARRRRQIVASLVELAEDNADLSFEAVFRIALADEDADTRVEAVRGLWESEDRGLIPVFLGLLREDREPRVRAEAALALGRFVLQFELGHLREKHFLPVEEALRQVIEDRREEPQVRARALEAMGACTSRPWVRDAIRAAYESDQYRLRIAAIHAMGRSGEDRWLPLLLRELASDDPEARYEAALACGSIADPQAVPHLAPLLHDDDQQVRQAAISALGQIGGQQAKELLLSLQDDPSPAIQDAVADALAEVEFAESPLSLRLFLDER
ncbi:hypothetical protein HRbin25_00227 [bacterium HR25]|jgi:HEAT repeat protein|nr:hypothetical protein HRbin25_00227 [bacterium HR25]